MHTEAINAHDVLRAIDRAIVEAQKYPRFDTPCKLYLTKGLRDILEAAYPFPELHQTDNADGRLGTGRNIPVHDGQSRTSAHIRGLSGECYYLVWE